MQRSSLSPGMDGLPTWSLMKYRRFVEVAGGREALQTLLRVLDRVARRCGVSIANVATRYVLEQPAVAGVIVGAQAHFILDKIAGAIRSLGGRFEDIVRTRIFPRNLDDWEAIARVHGERFRDVLPANTLVQASLVGDPYLVEIEAEADVPS